MRDFDFINPTRIIFGKKSEEKIGDVLKAYGFKKIMLICGQNSVKRSGLFDFVTLKIKEAKLDFVEYSGITPNPELRFVEEGLRVAKQYEPDCLLAIGGGSVIDVAKSICANYFYEGHPFDFNLKKAVPTKTLPLGVILTIAAAGSESSDSCVITDPTTKNKTGFNHPLNRPLFAIEDPELLFTLPKFQIAVGVADMMMHTMERYFGASDGNMICDEWALALLKHEVENARIAYENPTDYEAQAALMLDSSLSHDGLTAIGKTKSPFVVHALEHAVSGYKPDVTHGAGIAICYLGWAKYVYKQDLKKFAALARKLFNIEEQNDEKASIIGIEAMRDFYISLGIPTSLREVGITKSDLPELVRLASCNGTRVIGLYPQPLNESDIEAVYTLCL